MRACLALTLIGVLPGSRVCMLYFEYNLNARQQRNKESRRRVLPGSRVVRESILYFILNLGPFMQYLKPTYNFHTLARGLRVCRVSRAWARRVSYHTGYYMPCVE